MLSLAPTLADLPFRGDRNYLHSTDLYPALTAFAKKQFSPKAFVESLIIRQAVGHQIQLNFDGSTSAFGSFRIRDGASYTKGWLVETDQLISSRIPFDEATATQLAITGPGFARFAKLLPQYSMFELLLILTKIVASQQKAAHWWICQVEFLSPLLELAPLECRLHKKISSRYLILEIYQAGQSIGTARGIAGSVSYFDNPRSNP